MHASDCLCISRASPRWGGEPLDRDDDGDGAPPETCDVADDLEAEEGMTPHASDSPCISRVSPRCDVAEDLEAEEMMPPVDLARTQSIGGAGSLVDLVSNLSIVSSPSHKPGV